MEKLLQLQSLKEVKDCILVEMKEMKKLYKYTDLPNSRELAQHIEYNCHYCLNEDFDEFDKKVFPNEVGTYVFHKVFMEYEPFLYMKWYEENLGGFNEENPFLKVEDYQKAVKDVRATYEKDFPNSCEKMVYGDLKRAVLCYLQNIDDQYDSILRSYRIILGNRNSHEKKTQKELTELLETLSELNTQTENLKIQFNKLALKNSKS